MPIADFNLDDFRAHFTNAARQYLFFVYLTFPDGAAESSTNTSGNQGKAIDPKYLVRSTTFPGRAVSAIEVPWQGYKYNLGGTSTVEDWTCTFTMDKESSLYNRFAAWIDLVHNIKTNEHGDPETYMKDQRIDVLRIDGSGTLKSINLYGAWPTTLGALTLDYGAQEAITFDVTFKYLRPSYDGEGQTSSN